MSKTFKSAVSHREVRIWPTDAGFAVAVLDDGLNESMSTQLAPADAPAICLAILEAAGVQAIPFDEGPESEPGHAVWALRHHVQASEAKAKETADREALEMRRDELAREFGGHDLCEYRYSTTLAQNAIDRVIELEDKAKS